MYPAKGKLWNANPRRGGYSQSERPMLYIAVSRSQVKELRDIIALVDSRRNTLDAVI